MPLHLAAIDRLDPRGQYDVDNTRLLFGPLNMLRSNHPSDELIVQYIERVRETVEFEEIRRHEDAGGVCPACAPRSSGWGRWWKGR